MDRSREANRRSATLMTAAAGNNGVARRRQRSSSGTRESLDDAMRDRAVAEKRERDRESLNRSKRRRRSERFSGRSSERVEEGDDESEEEEEESVLGFEDDNTASFQTHSHHRKSFPPLARAPRQAAAAQTSFKIADEMMIGVPVPRKARSACVKRSSHDCRTSSGSGGGFAPASPASNQSFEAASPSSSNISVKQRTKPNGPKTRLQKPSESPASAAQEELEIEIAEVLFGLRKHSQSSKKEDDDVNSQISPEFNAAKKMKIEGDDSSSAPAGNSSVISAVKIESQCPVKIEVSIVNLEKSSGLNVEPRRMDGAEIASASRESQDRVNKVERSEEGAGKRDGAENVERFDTKNSTLAKGVLDMPEIKSRKEDNNKFKFDLMASPPMPSSPERDAFVPLASGSKPMALDSTWKVNLLKDEGEVVKKEAVLEEGRDKKVETREWLKLDLEKPSQDDGWEGSSIKLQSQGQKQQQHQLAKAAFPKLERSAQPSSMPLPVAVGGWPNGLPTLGYMPPYQTVKPVEGIPGSTPAVQPTELVASQPRPKRSATHYYIARNIQLHQQFVKTNHIWPENMGSTSLSSGPRPNNLYVLPPPAESLIHGNPSLQGGFNLNSAQDKGKIVPSIPHLEEKASESANFIETTSKKHQSPAAVGHLLPGPAFTLPMSHKQPVTSKSQGSAKNPSLGGNSAAVSFNYPSSVSANEAPPHMTILQSNGYPFPISTPAGNPPAVRGGNPGQQLPFLSGSFYTSQMFHPSQFQQQQSHRDTSASSGSLSSHKQPHLQGAQLSGNNLLSSTNVQKQQSQKQIGGENSSTVADSRGLHTQKSAYGQNFTVPLQPLNFSMSFASFNGSSTSSNLNFSSVSQNPAVFKANGYHIVPAPQVVQQKNHQITDANNRGGSTNLEDSKKVIVGKSAAMSNGQTLVFENSSRTLNFVSSPVNGNWPHCTITATSLASSSPVLSIPPNSQQLQNQKPHVPQQQQQQQQHQSGRSKSMATTTLPASSIGSKFPNNASVFPQTPATSQAVQWKNSAASLAACSSLNLKQYQQQQQLRTQGGQNQISFAGNSKPSSVQSQGQQQIPIGSQSQSSLLVGPPPQSKANSTGSNKTGSSAPTAQSQQAENSTTGAGQKSSPVCGRNIPSIISSCPSHLSELKY